MKIKIEMKGDFRELRIPNSSFTVGSNKSCDIALALKEVGDVHIEITQHKDTIYLTDLDSGYKTRYGDKVITPLSRVKISPSQPILFSKIKLFVARDDQDFSELLNQELAEEYSEDQVDVLDLLEEEVAKDKEKQAEKKMVEELQESFKSPAVKNESYKPDFTADLGDILSESSEEEATYEEEKSSTVADLAAATEARVGKKKARTREIQIRSQTKKSDKKGAKKKAQRTSNVRTEAQKQKELKLHYKFFLIVFIIAIVGGVYYKENIKSFPAHSNQQVAHKIKKEVVVKSSSAIKMQVILVELKRLLNNEFCTGNILSALCLMVNEYRSEKPQGAKLGVYDLDGHVHVFLEEGFLDFVLGKDFNYSEADKDRLRKILEIKYKDIANPVMFIRDGEKYESQKAIKIAKDYKLLLKSLLALSYYLEDTKKLVGLNLYVMSSNDGLEHKLEAFLEFDESVLKFKNITSSDQEFKLKRMLISNLNKDTPSFFPQLGRTHLAPTAKNLKKEFLAQRYLPHNLKYLEYKVCIEETKFICDQFKKRSYLDEYEGVILDKKKLVFLFNGEKRKDFYQKKYGQLTYPDVDRKRLMSYFQKLKLQMSKEEFIKNDYIANDRQTNLDYHRLLYYSLDFIDSKNKKSLRDIDEIVLIDFEVDTNEMKRVGKNILIMNDTFLRKLPLHKVKHAKYLWRSQLPYMRDLELLALFFNKI